MSHNEDGSMTNTLTTLRQTLGLTSDQHVVRCEIPIDSIVSNPHQPRKVINPDSIDFLELVASIREHGLLQPVVVTQSVEERDRYVLMAGERRWRAMVQINRETGAFARVPAAVLRTKEAGLRDTDLLVKALTENVIRTNLDTSELAIAIQQLKEISGWTYEQMAESLGLTVGRVQSLAAVARYEPVLDAVRDRSITQSQAIAIGKGAPDEKAAAQLVGKVAGKDVKAVARMVKATKPVKESSKEELVKTPPPMVDIDKLPIARLVGGGQTPREEIYQAIQRTCEILGWFPARS